MTKPITDESAQVLRALWFDFVAEIEPIRPKLHAYCLRLSGSVWEAEDLTQEILIRVYQNLKSYRAESGSFQNWIMRVARNLIIDHYRQVRRFPQTGGSEELETMNIRDDKSPNPQRAAEQVEASRFLQGGLQSLSPELKEAIVLRDLEGMAYGDMAELLNVPEGTVKSRINRGRLELAKLLVKRRSQLGIQM